MPGSFRVYITDIIKQPTALLQSAVSNLYLLLNTILKTINFISFLIKNLTVQNKYNKTENYLFKI